MRRALFLALAILVLPMQSFAADTLSGTPLTPAQQKSIFQRTAYYDATDGCLSSVDDETTPGTGSLMGVHMPDTDTDKLTKAIDKYIADQWPTSPFIGHGDLFVKYGSKYNVNPALAVGQSTMENGMGTNSSNTDINNFFNVTNRSPGSYGDQYNGPTRGSYSWQKYPDMDASMDVYFHLIDENYIGPPNNFTTVAQIIHKYSPDGASGNPVGQEARYVRAVKGVMHKITDSLTQGAGSTSFSPAALVPTAHAAPGSDTATVGAASDVLEGHKLPATAGGTGSEGATSGFAFGDPKSPDELKYFINMRWTYAQWDWAGHPHSVDNIAYNWMLTNHPKMIVTNPSTHKSVIVAALDAGPAPWTGTTSGAGSPPDYWDTPQLGTPDEYDGRVSGLSPSAFSEVGATETVNGRGDSLNYAWADQTDPLGATTKSVGDTSAAGGGSCLSAGGGTGDGSNAAIVATAQAELALGLVGTGPEGNSGPVCKYQGSACGEAWCADFVSWVYKTAGVAFKNVDGAPPGIFNEPERIAVAWNVGLYFKALNSKDPSKYAYGSPSGGDAPHAGYIITFNHGTGHVGIIESVDGNTIHTIEGNAGPTVTKGTYQKSDPDVKEWGGYK